MKYVLYKLVFGDPQGAEVLKRFKPWFSSMKELDEDYKGPDYYWNFFQLGELGDIRLTLLKWEIWSTWKDSDPTQEALSGYVGSSAGIF
ncbi:MAG: hypothetical protein GY870_04130, partial [archaeon]|nr:hypothetical protein [archaeon]